MTVTLYARRKQWPLEDVTVELRHSKIHINDCADCETREDARVDRIDCKILVSGALTVDQKTRLLQISQRCPVHRTLESKIDIQTKLEG